MGELLLLDRERQRMRWQLRDAAEALVIAAEEVRTRTAQLRLEDAPDCAALFEMAVDVHRRVTTQSA